MTTPANRAARRRLAIIRWMCLTCLGLLALASPGARAEVRPSDIGAPHTTHAAAKPVDAPRARATDFRS